MTDYERACKLIELYQTMNAYNALWLASDHFARQCDEESNAVFYAAWNIADHYRWLLDNATKTYYYSLAGFLSNSKGITMGNWQEHALRIKRQGDNERAAQYHKFLQTV